MIDTVFPRFRVSVFGGNGISGVPTLLGARTFFPVFRQTILRPCRLDVRRFQRSSPWSEPAFDRVYLRVRKIGTLWVPSEPFRRFRKALETRFPGQRFCF